MLFEDIVKFFLLVAGMFFFVLGSLFRTIDSLYTEAHETPLLIRSEKLALQY